MQKSKTLSQWMLTARAGHWAIPVFCVNTTQAVQRIGVAAEKLGAPVIFAWSPDSAKNLTMKDFVFAVVKQRMGSVAPMFMAIDHAHKELELMQALRAGMELLHFDGSAGEHAKSLKIVRRVVRAAHKRMSIVEGELPEHGSAKAIDSLQAARFVRETGVNCLGLLPSSHKGVPVRMTPTLKQLQSTVSPVQYSLHSIDGITGALLKRLVRQGVVLVRCDVSTKTTAKTIEQFFQSLGCTHKV